jgi:uncharacterized membrane protein YvlD (DUF360 family)
MKEPVLVIIAGVGTIVQLFMVVLIAFGVPITSEQQAAITALIGAILALIVRPLVTPMASLPPGVAGEIADNKAAAAADKK